MVPVVLAVLASLLVSGLLALYVAFPHRGRALPVVPWLGRLMHRAADAAPVIGQEDRDLARSR